MKNGEIEDETSDHFNDDYNYNEDNDEVEISGKLKEFLEKWDIVDMGG